MGREMNLYALYYRLTTLCDGLETAYDTPTGLQIGLLLCFGGSRGGWLLEVLFLMGKKRLFVGGLFGADRLAVFEN